MTPYRATPKLLQQRRLSARRGLGPAPVTCTPGRRLPFRPALAAPGPRARCRAEPSGHRQPVEGGDRKRRAARGCRGSRGSLPRWGVGAVALQVLGGRLHRDQSRCRLSPVRQAREPAPRRLLTAAAGGGRGVDPGASWAGKAPCDSLLPATRVQRVQGWGRDPQRVWRPPRTAAEAGAGAGPAAAIVGGGAGRRSGSVGGALAVGRASTCQMAGGRGRPRRVQRCRWGRSLGSGRLLSSPLGGQARQRAGVTSKDAGARLPGVPLHPDLLCALGWGPNPSARSTAVRAARLPERSAAGKGRRRGGDSLLHRPHVRPSPRGRACGSLSCRPPGGHWWVPRTLLSQAPPQHRPL